MNKQLQNIRDKLKRESQSEETSPGADNDAVAAERQEVLKGARSFAKPLMMSPQKALRVTALIVAAILVVTLLVFVVLIYRFQSDGDVVYRASQIIPFPAAQVDGSFISYNDYLFELRALKQYSQNPMAGGEIDFDSDEGQQQLEELQVLALDEARDKLMVEDMAVERGVSLDDEQVETAVTDFMAEEDSEEQFEQSLEDLYGWDMSDFERVLSSQLLQQEIVRQKAVDVRDEVVEGEQEFADAAREYSDDGSAEDGGDIGYVSEDSEFVPEFEAAALDLDEGEVSDVVETQFGFHVLKATDMDSEEGVRISHILISPSFLQEEIDEHLQDAQSRSFIGVEFLEDEDAVDPQLDPDADAEEPEDIVEED